MVDIGTWLMRCAKASKNFSVQVPAETYGILLQSVVGWIEAQLNGKKHGANIPQLGRFTWIKKGDRHFDQGAPVQFVFIASEQWLQQHKVQSHRPGSQSLAPCTDLNYSRLAVESNVSKDLVRVMVDVMMHELGHLVSKGSSVRIPFGSTGFLRAENRRITFQYKSNMERKAMGKSWKSAELMKTASLERFLETLQTDQRAATAPVPSFYASAPTLGYTADATSFLPPVSPSLGQVGSPSKRSSPDQKKKKEKTQETHRKLKSDQSSRKKHRRRLTKSELTRVEESMDEIDLCASTLPLTLRQTERSLSGGRRSAPLTADGRLASVRYTSSRRTHRAKTSRRSVREGRSSRPEDTHRQTQRTNRETSDPDLAPTLASNRMSMASSRSKTIPPTKEAISTARAKARTFHSQDSGSSNDKEIKIPKFMVSQGQYTFNRTVPDHVEKTSELAFHRIQQKMKEAREEEERVNQSVQDWWKQENDKYMKKKESSRRRQDDLNKFLAQQVEEADARREAEEYDIKFVGHTDEKRTYPVQAPWDPEKELANKRAWKKQIDETVSVGNAIKEKQRLDKIEYEKRLAEAYKKAIIQEREEAFARKAADQEALNKAWKRQEMMNNSMVQESGSRRVPGQKMLLTKV